MAYRWIGLLFGLGLCACDAQPVTTTTSAAASATTAAPAPSVATTSAPSNGPKKSFGEPITESTDTSLASIAKAPGDYADKTVRTTGKVVAVCKAAGCWMEIGDETSRAHIKMFGHSFFVPKDCDGRMAVVQGTVKSGAPVDECGAKDSCGGEANGVLAKVEIVATGVELID